MKYNLIICFLLFFTLFAEAKTRVKLLYVIDGDTVKIEAPGTLEKRSFRLDDIDTYETKKINRAYKQAYANKITIDEVIRRGKRQKKYLEKLLKNKKIYIVTSEKKDRYKRLTGTLYAGKININKKIQKKYKMKK